MVSSCCSLLVACRLGAMVQAGMIAACTWGARQCAPPAGMVSWRRRHCPCAGVQVRATHGAHQGAWYFEVNVRQLGSTGHARVGWATRSAELQAPVRWHTVQTPDHSLTSAKRLAFSVLACCRSVMLYHCRLSLKPVSLFHLHVLQVGYDQHGYGYRDLEGSKVRSCCIHVVPMLAGWHLAAATSKPCHAALCPCSELLAHIC